ADLVVSNYDGGLGYTVSVLLNQGNGSFAAQVEYVVGYGPVSVTSVDLDGDGDADLVVANAVTSTVSVLLNQGNGTFATQAQYGAGSSLVSLTTADLNGDGRADIAVVGSNQSTGFGAMTVLLNQGNGTFAATGYYVVGVSPSSVISAD